MIDRSVAPEAPNSLKRSMRTSGVLLLTLSAVTPASAVFVVIPGAIQQAGTGAFLSLLAAAVVALAMAFVYAELASAFPHAGGEYAMVGGAISPFVGFIYLGMNVVGSTLAPALLALGASTYLTALWPGVQSIPTATIIIAIATAFGILNIRVNAWVTGLFLLIEICALTALAGLGFLHMHRTVTVLVTHPVALIGANLTPTPLALMGLATTVGVFAYNGFGAAVYFSEEMHEASRDIGRTILRALALTLAFVFVPTSAVLLGATNLKELLASESPVSDFVLRSGGPAWSAAIGLGVALAIVNAVIAIVLLNARFFYSSGRDRVWHPRINRTLIRIHPRYASPWAATVLAGITGIASCFIPFNILLILNGTGVVVVYILLCIGSILGRLSGRTAHGTYRMPLFPLPPIFGLLCLVYVLYANWIDLTVGRPSLVATAVILAAAATYCTIMRRRRGLAWGGGRREAPDVRLMQPPPVP